MAVLKALVLIQIGSLDTGNPLAAGGGCFVAASAVGPPALDDGRGHRATRGGSPPVFRGFQRCSPVRSVEQSQPPLQYGHEQQNGQHPDDGHIRPPDFP